MEIIEILTNEQEIIEIMSEQANEAQFWNEFLANIEINKAS